MRISADVITGISVGIEYVEDTPDDEEDENTVDGDTQFKHCIIVDLVLLRVLIEF